MDQTILRRRLLALRERRKVSQDALSEVIGFNDRQTLSDIELGKRNVTPAEVVRIAQFFGVDPGYFTDPLELAGEARFSWRKSASNADDLESFERRAGSWIATYRYLSRLKDESVNSLLMQTDLTSKSSFEEAAAEGDAVSRALALGDVPAVSLASVLEDKLDTLVLQVATLAGVSGAACQLGPLNTIIINRNEAEGRRSFDMAHEFFHLITWHHMPPPHIEESDSTSATYRRIEQLADNFASGLLMPKNALLSRVARVPIPSETSALIDWIKNAASHFHVSGQALKWRLVGLRLLKKTTAERLDDILLRADCSENEKPPARFSRRFMEILGWGIDQGHISVRRAAQVVGTTLDDLADAFAEYGLKTPFDL